MSARLAAPLLATALAFAVGSAFAQGKHTENPPHQPKDTAGAQPQHKEVSPPEIRYQAGSSPLADAPMHQDMNPKAPARTTMQISSPKRVSCPRC